MGRWIMLASMLAGGIVAASCSAADDVDERVANLVWCDRACAQYFDCAEDINYAECSERCYQRTSDAEYIESIRSCGTCMEGASCEAVLGECLDLCPELPIPTEAPDTETPPEVDVPVIPEPGEDAN
jgi:hypothetical protein